MEAAPAYPARRFTLGDSLAELGIFGIIFPLIAIGLGIWLWILIYRPRPLMNYLAYLGATLYPSFLGLFGAAFMAIGVFRDLANNGIASPEPAILARHIGEMLMMLVWGSGLTCLYWPLGILVLVIRNPK